MPSQAGRAAFLFAAVSSEVSRILSLLIGAKSLITTTSSTTNSGYTGYKLLGLKRNSPCGDSVEPQSTLNPVETERGGGWR